MEYTIFEPQVLLRRAFLASTQRAEVLCDMRKTKSINKEGNDESEERNNESRKRKKERKNAMLCYAYDTSIF